MPRAGFNVSELNKKIDTQRPSSHHTPLFGEKNPLLRNMGTPSRFAVSGWSFLGWEHYGEPRGSGEGRGAAGTLPEPPCPAVGDVSGTSFTLSLQTAPVTQAHDDDSPDFLTSVSNWSHLPERLGAKQPFPRHLISQVSSERSSNALKLPKSESDNQVFASLTPAKP